MPSDTKISTINNRKSYQTTLLGTIVFSLCFCQSILANLKDAVLLTSCQNGVSAIPFIQVWGILPAALITLSLFLKLNRKLGKERACYTVISCFLAFFLLFAFLLFPYREQLRLEAISMWLAKILPTGLNGFIVMIEHWHLALFYVSCELFGSTLIAFFFWGIVNGVTRAKQAERLYGPLQLGTTLASIAAGTMANYLIQTSYNPSLPFGRTPWEQTLIQMTLLIAIVGIGALLLFRLLFRMSIMKDEEEQTRKKMPSLRESISHLKESRYLLLLTAIVTFHSILLIISELIWKEKLQQTFQDPNDIMTLMNDAMWFIGLLSVTGAVLTPYLTSKKSWRALTLASPILVAFGTSLFFGSLFFGEALANLGFLGIHSAEMIAVYAGTLQVTICKAARFSFASTSKEIALAALPTEKKWMGKAGVDSIGIQVAKAGSAGGQQVLLIILGSVSACIPFFSVFIIGILVLWFYATFAIGKEYVILCNKQENSRAKNLATTPQTNPIQTAQNF